MVDGTLFLHETEEKLTRLYQTAYSILRTRQDAEDAVQQALLKAWASRAGAWPETFGPWLMRRHILYRIWRRICLEALWFVKRILTNIY